MKTDIKGFSESEVPKLIQIFQKMKYTEQKFKPIQMDSIHLKNNTDLINKTDQMTKKTRSLSTNYYCPINNCPLQRDVLSCDERVVITKKILNNQRQFVQTMLYKFRKEIIKYIKTYSANLKNIKKTPNVILKQLILNQPVIFLDGGNIGYFNKYYRDNLTHNKQHNKRINKHSNFCIEQINTIWDYFKDTGYIRVLILSEVHKNNKLNKTYLSKFQSEGLIYFTPRSLDDDLFWLWGSFQCPNSYVITNDKMGNHKHHYLKINDSYQGKTINRLFDKFYDTQVITYLFNNPKPIPKINCKSKQKNKQRSKLVIQIPKAYSTNIQFNNQTQNEIRTEIGSKTLNLVQNLIYNLNIPIFKTEYSFGGFRGKTLRENRINECLYWINFSR